jgi:ribosomal protein S27AE
MNHIVDKTREMVERIKTGEFADPAFGTLKTPCPRCGAKIHEGYKHFTCEKCDYSLWKVVASRQWEPAEMDELLSKRVIGPLQGFRSKMGRPFAAMIKLKDDHTPEFDFGQSDADADGEEVDFSTQEALGACPKCGGRVFEHGMAYVCEKAWARAGPAISAPARSSCSRKSAAATCRSCWPPAAPTCSRASSRTRRGASFPPSWCVIRRPARSVSSSSRARRRRAGPRPSLPPRPMPPTKPR